MNVASLLIVEGCIGLVLSIAGLVWGLQRRKPKRRTVYREHPHNPGGEPW